MQKVDFELNPLSKQKLPFLKRCNMSLEGGRLRRKMKKILVATTWSVLLVARKTRRSVWTMSGLSQVFLPAMETLMKLKSRDSVLSAFFCPGLVLESGLLGMASIQEPRNSVMMKLTINFSEITCRQELAACFDCINFIGSSRVYVSLNHAGNSRTQHQKVQRCGVGGTNMNRRWRRYKDVKEVKGV